MGKEKPMFFFSVGICTESSHGVNLANSQKVKITLQLCLLFRNIFSGLFNQQNARSFMFFVLTVCVVQRDKANIVSRPIRLLVFQ